MSSILLSQSMALATAMAVSGTVILLAFRLQKSNSSSSSSSSSTPHYPPSCIISSDHGKKKKKMKKRVRFAEDVVDPIGNSDEYRKLRTSNNNTSINSHSHSSKKVGKLVQQIMPPNRVALYNGMLKDKVIQKLTYSY